MRAFIQLAAACAVTLCAPLAASAQTSERNINPATLAKVSAHVWTIKGYPIVGIVVGKTGTLVIDTGLGTPNGRIVADAARKLSPPGQKLYLATTHYHPEHAAGQGGFPPDTIVIRPRAQQAELDDEGQRTIDGFSARSAVDKALLEGARITQADILFDTDYRQDLGGVSVRIAWFGPAHTRGDAVVLVEQDGILFSGDVVQNKIAPNFFCTTCTPQSWLKVLDGVAGLKPRTIVPDHTDMGDGAALIAEQRAFLTDLQSRALALKAQGTSAEEAGKIVLAEFETRYAGWISLNRVLQGVARTYTQ